MIIFRIISRCFSRCSISDMKYIFRLGSNLLIVEYKIPVSCSKWLVLKNLWLGDASSQTHVLSLNATHSKILVASQTNGNSWSVVKPVDAWCPDVAHNRLHIPLTMNTFTYVEIIFDIFKVSATGLQHRTENSLISPFKSPTSVYPITFPVLFLYTKLLRNFISSKTILKFFSCSFRLSKFISSSIWLKPLVGSVKSSVCWYVVLQ